MLVFSRQRDEAILIGDDIRVSVVDIRGEVVRLGLEVPKEISVHREEVYKAIKELKDESETAEIWPPPTRETWTAPRIPPVEQTEPNHFLDHADLACLAGVTIRAATLDDAETINAIYNPYVESSTCTYQTTPTTIAERLEWLAMHDDVYPVVVAERRGEIVGWGSLFSFHARDAYRHTVENAVYVRRDEQRYGIGQAILAELIHRARQVGHRTVVALIDAEQPASVALHRKFGFAESGRLRQVGFKFGRWLDVIHMQLIL